VGVVWALSFCGQVTRTRRTTEFMGTMRGRPFLRRPAARFPMMLPDGNRQIQFLVEGKSIGGFSGSPAFLYIPPLSHRPGTTQSTPEYYYRLIEGSLRVDNNPRNTGGINLPR